MIRATAEPDREGTLRLSDGRIIAYSEWGEPLGRPVVLLHGMPGSRLICPDRDATVKAGVRLITVDRPGYGRSDPRPWVHPLTDWVADFAALASELRLSPCPLVGWSSGGPYALAVARFAPDRVSSVALVAGDASLHEVPNALDSLPPEARQLVALAEADPASALQGIQARVAWYADDPTNLFDRATASGGTKSARDRPDVAAAMRTMFREGARQGTAGFVGDWLATAQPWGFATSQIAIPVSIYWGEEDQLVERPHTEYLARTIPGARLTIFPAVGHDLAFAHWAEILDHLA